MDRSGRRRPLDGIVVGMAIGLCIAVAATGLDMGRMSLLTPHATPDDTSMALAEPALPIHHAAFGAFALVEPSPIPQRDDPFWQATQSRGAADPFTPVLPAVPQPM